MRNIIKVAWKAFDGTHSKKRIELGKVRGQQEEGVYFLQRKRAQIPREIQHSRSKYRADLYINFQQKRRSSEILQDTDFDVNPADF